MSTAKELLRDAERCLERIEAARKDLCTIESQVDRLLKPDVLPEGTRVRLKRNWNTPEDRKRSPGWASSLHFMHPGNPATIIEVRVASDLRILYIVKFDDQTCYLNNGDAYNSEYCYTFSQKSVEKI